MNLEFEREIVGTSVSPVYIFRDLGATPQNNLTIPKDHDYSHCENHLLKRTRVSIHIMSQSWDHANNTTRLSPTASIFGFYKSVD